jgi:hypothetical protein
MEIKSIMKEVYSEEEFSDEILECPKCGWKGKGSEAVIIDLYGVTDVQEIHCPNCDHYLAGLKRAENLDSEDAGSDEFLIG